MPRGVGLTRERVIDLAAMLVDARGADALDLTAIAEAAGVQKPSLYKHVDGLPAIREALTLRAWADLDRLLNDLPTGCGAGLVALASRWRRWGLGHPGLFVVSARTHVGASPEVEAAGAALTARLLARVGEAGAPDPVSAARALRALVHGFVLLEVAGGFGLAPDVGASFDRAVAALVAGLLRAPA